MAVTVTTITSAMFTHRAELQFSLLLFSIQLLFCMLEAVLAIAGKRAGLGGSWSGTQAGDKTDA